MKRLIAAVSFAVIAAPAVATPFEQTELDRALPSLAQENVRYAAAWADDHNLISPAP
jgi:hypothetical protein